MNDVRNGVTIIVCTYNGSNRLGNTIKFIANQKVISEIPWELIIVDNASTDDTSKIAKELWLQNGSNPAQFRILQEYIPGLTNARNTGIAAARYESLIFCDDDNWLDENYVQKSFEILDLNVDVGAAGGNGKAVSNIDIPNWFEEYKDYYATGPQGSKTGDITNEKAFIYGAGGVFRKSALDSIRAKGFHNRMMSKTGKSLLTGDDNEYCYALNMAGYKIWYEEDLKFSHYMPPERLTIQYFGSLVEAYSYSSYLLLPYRLILKGDKIPTYRFSVLWNLSLVLYFIFIYDLPDIAKYLFTSRAYKIKLNWKVRKGNMLAILRNPGYQLNLYEHLKDAEFRKR